MLAQSRPFAPIGQQQQHLLVAQQLQSNALSQHHQQQHQQLMSQQLKSTLWMGLEPWMDEVWVKSLWMSQGAPVTIKTIRDKMGGRMSAGYCFVDFDSPQAAQKHIQLNGQPIPNTNKYFRLNWASGGGLVDPRVPEHSIFVGDLAPEVNDFVLLSAFQSIYPSTKSAKVVIDPVSGNSRGFGFVRFTDEKEQLRSLKEMSGYMIGSRQIRVSSATPKSRSNMLQQQHQLQQQQHHPHHMLMAPQQMGQHQQTSQNTLNQYATDPTNTTVFIGGLNTPVTEEEIRSYFAALGEISYVKIPSNKGCAFVCYSRRESAEAAIAQMNGFQLGANKIRLSWGRPQSMQPSPTSQFRTASSFPTAAMYFPSMPGIAFQPQTAPHNLNMIPLKHQYTSSVTGNVPASLVSGIALADWNGMVGIANMSIQGLSGGGEGDNFDH